MTLEEMQEQMLQMQEQLATLKSENENLQNTVNEKAKREQELMEHNQKLFLRVTSKKEEQETNDEEIPFWIDKDTFEKLSEREIKELKELIEEGEE